jgi:Lon protease-like protein
VSQSGGAQPDSDTDVIAVFPLNHVLLPSMPLPLHVFEPRYRELLRDITAAPGQTSFGVVALTRGGEVGTAGVDSGGDRAPTVASVGTIAEVLEVQPYDDGASDLFTVGSRRFRIDRLVDGKPYLRAEVSYLDEPGGPVVPELRARVTALHTEHATLRRRLTGQAGEFDPPADDAQLSYQLAAAVPLAGDDRQALLEQPDCGARLALLARLLRREITLLRTTHTIAVSSGMLQLYVRSN